MSREPDSSPVAGWLLLGQAWLARGRADVAATHFERALAHAPRDPEVHRQAARLKVFLEDFRSAVDHAAIAAELAPDDRSLVDEAMLVRELSGAHRREADLPARPGGRLRFPARYLREHHRSGWRPAMEALYALHHPDGVRFESFLDELFAVEHPRPGRRSGPELYAALRRPSWPDRITSEERHLVPIREPWVGFLHNPFGMPPWFYADHSPEHVLAKSAWRESLPACVGLFTLSEHMARWLREATGKPVDVAYLPSEIPELGFEFERFLDNPDKRLIQVGWWLRRQTAIDRLPIPDDNPLGYRKLRLVPGFVSNAHAQVEGMRDLEFQRLGPPPAGAGAVEVRSHVPDDEYDRLLSCNVVMVQLDAANANNAVVECLARATPLLVNRLPAVEEYLGRDYPLYFDDLRDAAAQAMDTGRLKAAHEHLRSSPQRERLDPQAFRRSVEESSIYRSL